MGSVIWARSMGASSNDAGNSLAVDATGQVYLTGIFEGSVDFDPGASVHILTASANSDIYFAKYDASGNFLWAKSMGGSGADGGYSIDRSANGDVHLAGYFEGTVDFNPGAGSANLISTGSKDIFFAKYDNTGSFLWAHAIAGGDGSLGAHLSADSLGNTYLGGSYFATIDCDPSTAVENRSSVGGHDIYLAKYDPNGNYNWAISLGGSGFDHCNDVYADKNGSVFITGYFSSTANFGSGGQMHTLSSSAISDIYAAKYSSNGDYRWAVAMGDIGTDVGYGIAVNDLEDVFISGYFASSADFDPSAATFNLNSNGSFDAFITKLGAGLCLPSVGVEYQSACDSFTWVDGNTYTSSTTAPTFTLTNAAGCDSVLTLDLSITNSSSSIDYQTACDSFTWLDGNTYTSSTTAPTFTLTNAAGCDSVLTLNLTINRLDSTVSQNAQLLTANESGASYQWLDCPFYTIIMGENGQSFSPSSNGAYAVIITKDGCIDTSACYSVAGISLAESRLSNRLSLYPNPSNGHFSLDLGRVCAFADIHIKDMSGKLISKATFQNSQVIDLYVEAAAGVYFVIIELKRESTVIRLTIE